MRPLKCAAGLYADQRGVFVTDCGRLKLKKTTKLCCRIACWQEKSFCDRLWEAKT